MFFQKKQNNMIRNRKNYLKYSFLIRIILNLKSLLLPVLLVLLFVISSCKTCKCPAYSENIIPQHVELPKFVLIC